MERTGYGILEFEAIWSMARDLIYNVLAEGMMLDEEGNYVGNIKDPTEWLEKRTIDLRFKYLNFRECEELHSITLSEAADMYAKDIMEKYLFESVPFIRKVMRKGSLTPYSYVSDEVPDQYLDEMICHAWKVDLMIWASSWDRDRTENKDV